MGSTSEKSCFKLTSCNPNTANQNIRAYGILLLAALSTLLLILYNCSDQVLTARERRLAKSREAAARSARETSKARQRWRSAKDAAKKHARGLQAHLSHTFSRKKGAKDPEKLKILDRVKSDIDDDPLPPPHPNNYFVLFCLVYCVTGIAYVLAIVFEPGTAQLWSVLLPVVLTLIATQPKDSEFMRILTNLCYPNWALEGFIIANAERYYGVWLITRCGLLLKSGYNLHHWSLCLAILILIGIFSRVIAFCCMLIFQKK